MQKVDSNWFNVLNDWRAENGLAEPLSLACFIGVDVEDMHPSDGKMIEITVDETITKEFAEFLADRKIYGFHHCPEEKEIYVDGDYYNYGDDIRVYYHPYTNQNPYDHCVEEHCKTFNAALEDRGIPINWPHWLQNWYINHFNDFRYGVVATYSLLHEFLKAKMPLRDRFKLMRKFQLSENLRTAPYNIYYDIYRNANILQDTLLKHKWFNHCLWDKEQEEELEEAMMRIAHDSDYYTAEEVKESWFNNREMHCFCEGCRIDTESEMWLDEMVYATDWKNMEWSIEFGSK